MLSQSWWAGKKSVLSGQSYMSSARQADAACGHLSTIPALDGTTFINVAGGTGMWIVEGHEVATGDTAS